MPLLGFAIALPLVPPLQVMLVGAVITVTAGLTVTTAVEVDVFPPVSFIVTVYVVVDDGHGLMFCEVAPLLHEYVYGLVPPAPMEFTIAQEPEHIELPVVVTVGKVQSITVIVLDSLMPQGLLTTLCITEYVPAVKKT